MEDTSVAVRDVSVSGTGEFTATLRVQHGTLQVTQGANVSGNGTDTLVITGNAAQINDRLESLRYAADADYYGTDEVQITTSRGTSNRTEPVEIRIRAVQDAVDDTLATDEDVPLSFNVLTGDNGANADDFENPMRVVSSVTQPANGTIGWGANGDMTFTPEANYSGTTRFTYKVMSSGVLESAEVIIRVDAVDDVPVVQLQADAFEAVEDEPFAITGVRVQEGDGQVLHTTLSVTHGTLWLAAGAQATGNGTPTLMLTGTAEQINAHLAGMVYVGDADYHGSDVLRVSASDGQLSADSMASVTVLQRADVVDDIVQTNEDLPVAFNVLTGAGASADNFESAARIVSSVTQPASGTISWSADGAMTFVPATNFHGSTSFTYTVTSAGTTETGTVIVHVAPVNDAPVAGNDAYDTYEDFPIAGMTVALNDTDVEGDSLAVTHAAVDATQGSVAVHPDGTLSFRPVPGFVGQALITYAVSDGNGGIATATVTVDVKPDSHVDVTRAERDAQRRVTGTPETVPSLPILATLSAIHTESDLLGLQLDALEKAWIESTPTPDLAFAAGGDIGHDGRGFGRSGTDRLSVLSSVRGVQAEALAIALKVREAGTRAIGDPLFDPIGLALLRGGEQPLALASYEGLSEREHVADGQSRTNEPGAAGDGGAEAAPHAQPSQGTPDAFAEQSQHGLGAAGFAAQLRSSARTLRTAAHAGLSSFNQAGQQRASTERDQGRNP